MNRLTRAAAAGAATTALGAAAMILGVATQESVPAPATVVAAPVEFYTCPACSRILGDTELDNHIIANHPELWAQITGDKK